MKSTAHENLYEDTIVGMGVAIEVCARKEADNNRRDTMSHTITGTATDADLDYHEGLMDYDDEADSEEGYEAEDVFGIDAEGFWGSRTSQQRWTDKNAQIGTESAKPAAHRAGFPPVA